MLGCQGLGHGGIPGGLLLAEDVAEDEDLTQAGNERDFGWLAGRDKALVAGAQAGIAVRGGLGGHVQHSADRGPAAPAVSAPAPGAAVAVEGDQTDNTVRIVAGDIAMDVIPIPFAAQRYLRRQEEQEAARRLSAEQAEIHQYNLRRARGQD